MQVYVIKSPEDVIEEMSRFSFGRTIGLRLFEGIIIEEGDTLRLPKSIGRIIIRRRCVFRFWRKEVLVEQEGDIGYFYRWFDEEFIDYMEKNK